MSDQIASMVVPSQFNGPPGSGNGGYVCGKLAGILSEPDTGVWTEVSLRAAVPLEKELRVEVEGDRADLVDGENIVASAKTVSLDLNIPSLPTDQEISDASQRYRWREDHPIPECFVCGPLRTKEDGLRIFAGPLRERDQIMVATPWRPHPNFADDDGMVPPEIIWAALDCPGAYAIDELETTSLKLLGRLTARTMKPIRAGTNCAVLGWYISSDGRKHEAGTAVFDEDGELAGAGKATWIELKT